MIRSESVKLMRCRKLSLEVAGCESKKSGILVCLLHEQRKERTAYIQSPSPRDLEKQVETQLTRKTQKRNKCMKS